MLARDSKVPRGHPAMTTDDKAQELMQQLAPSWNLLYAKICRAVAEDTGIIDNDGSAKTRQAYLKMPLNSIAERFHIQLQKLIARDGEDSTITLFAIVAIRDLHLGTTHVL